MKCNHCGYEEETNYKFCPNCGRKIKKNILKKILKNKKIIRGSVCLVVVFGILFAREHIHTMLETSAKKQKEYQIVI